MRNEIGGVSNVPDAVVLGDLITRELYDGLGLRLDQATAAAQLALDTLADAGVDLTPAPNSWRREDHRVAHEVTGDFVLCYRSTGGVSDGLARLVQGLLNGSEL